MKMTLCVFSNRLSAKQNKTSLNSYLVVKSYSLIVFVTQEYIQEYVILQGISTKILFELKHLDKQTSDV